LSELRDPGFLLRDSIPGFKVVLQAQIIPVLGKSPKLLMPIIAKITISISFFNIFCVILEKLSEKYFRFENVLPFPKKFVKMELWH
jgi:hypothetical protein